MVFFDEPEACMRVKQPSTPKLVEPLNLSREKAEKSSCMHANRRSVRKACNVMLEFEPDSKPQNSSVYQGHQSRSSERRNRGRNRGYSHMSVWPKICMIPAIPIPVPEFCFYDFMFGGMICFI